MSVPTSNMKRMFDSEAGGPDAATTLSLVSRAHHQVLEQECALVELAAHWADLHHPDSQPPPAVNRCPAPSRGGCWAGKAPRRSWSLPPPSWAPAWRPPSGRRER